MFDSAPWPPRTKALAMVECAGSIGPARVARCRVKRSFDFLTAVGLIVLFAPLLLTIAACIACESRGPVLFRQRRTGLKGRVFVIYKFRTMHVLEDGPDLRHAVFGDDRVTRVGRFLRKSSLDELAQLLNILKGEMSLVGPRPHALAHDDQFAAQIPAYPDRFAARPGLTGLAQVAGLRGEIGGSDGLAQRVEHDLRYIRDWSIWLDLAIIARTVPLLLRATNAY